MTPDLVPLAKSLSGFGLPLRPRFLVRPELDIWKPAEHNGNLPRQHPCLRHPPRVALEKFWTDDRFQQEIAAKSTIP